MFWIIFGTASFTALIISWGMMFWFSKGAMKAREVAKKNGFCPDCGAPLLHKGKHLKKNN